MGILSNIFSKIFPSSHPAASGPSDVAAAGTTAPAAAPAPITAMPEVDVEKMLDERNTQGSEKLNWRTSIVDLMKLLALDSSLTARKELAKELHYTGDTNDSAAMNIWLHKQVMSKIAANGGKVPADLQ